MFVATSSPVINTHPPSYIVAAATTTTTPATINGGIDTTNTNTTTPALSDIKLICTQRKKVCWKDFIIKEKSNSNTNMLTHSFQIS
jgi:hypothetical protein